MEMSEANGFDAYSLRMKRIAKGLHQHQLAAKLDNGRGINQGRISEWEHGERIPEERVRELKEILN